MDRLFARGKGTYREGMVQEVIAEIMSWFVPDVASYLSRLICGDKTKRAKLVIASQDKRSKRRARRRAAAKRRIDR